MNQRQISGLLPRYPNRPSAVRAGQMGTLIDPSGTYPQREYTAATDDAGAWSLTVDVPDTGSVLLRFLLPDGAAHWLHVAAGDPVTFEALLDGDSLPASVVSLLEARVTALEGALGVGAASSVTRGTVRTSSDAADPVVYLTGDADAITGALATRLSATESALPLKAAQSDLDAETAARGATDTALGGRITTIEGDYLQAADLAGYQATSDKGIAGGYASLDGTGKVPAAQLPTAAGGDMLASTYDTNGDGTVNSADTAASVPWSGVSGTPTTLAGYGITDAEASGTASSTVATHNADTTAHGQTAMGRALVTAADAAAARATIGAGTAATYNVPATGNAAVGEVVLGSDTRLGTTTDIAATTHAATSKTTPVDADELPLIDSAASNVLKKLTWANVKATAKTYFDTLYAAVTHTHAESDVTNLTTDLAAKAPLASPALTGTPTAPTAASGTNTTQIATTAFVTTAVAAGGGGSTSVGYLPFAYQVNADMTSSVTNVGGISTLAANGGTALVPIDVSAPLILDSISFRNGDATLARSYEWRLYREPSGGGSTLDEISGANGSESYTATAASTRTSSATSITTLTPGIYWLALRNTHATNTLLVYATALSTTQLSIQPNAVQSKTIGLSLTTTLDAVTSWSKVAAQVAVRLNGRVFGQSAAY